MRTEYLSDILFALGTNKAGFCGLIGIDTSSYRAWPETTEGKPLCINGRCYEKGIGTSAPTELYLELDKKYDSFTADIGMQQNADPTGRAAFEVIVDGTSCFLSGEMDENSDPVHISVPIAGAQKMTLRTTGAGQCNWCNALLTKSTDSVHFSIDRTDMSPFARVMTWDSDNAAAVELDPLPSAPSLRGVFLDQARLREFPEECLFPGQEIIASQDGSYIVPIDGVIGLEWVERRRLVGLGIEFAHGSAVPPIDEVRVEYWTGRGCDYLYGESRWQGKWRPVRCQINQVGNTWLFDLQDKCETRKVRWIFPAGKSVRIAKFLTYTNSEWDTVDLLLRIQTPKMGETAEIHTYNGCIIDPNNQEWSTQCAWDMGSSLPIKVRYTKPRHWGQDRTVIRVKMPNGAFSVAVDDVLLNGCVWVGEYGFFISTASDSMSLDDYKSNISERKTRLAEVREAADQTLPQVFDKQYWPEAQNQTDTLLSLACDNSKFLVERGGTVHYGPIGPSLRSFPFPYKMVPRFGLGEIKVSERHLDGEWLPIPVSTFKVDGLVYSMRAFVAPFGDTVASNSPWLSRRALGVCEFTIENKQPEPAQALINLSFISDSKSGECACLHITDERVIISKQDETLAIANIAEISVLKPQVDNGDLVLSGLIPGDTTLQFSVCLPGEKTNLSELEYYPNVSDLRDDVEVYWKQVLSSSAQIDVPDSLLTNLIKASQVHCMIAARNEDDGARISPWIAAMIYTALDSEAHTVIRGMDALGNSEFCRKALDYFISRYNDAGFLAVDYTIMSTGQHLWTLSDHCELTGNYAWLDQHIEKIAGVCRWIASQCEKTKKLDSNGDKIPEYGLIPPGVIADWNHWAYVFAFNGHFYAGLSKAANMLAKVGHPQADAFVKCAEDLRHEIIRAYYYAQGNIPVCQINDGNWVAGSPFEVYSPGPIEDYLSSDIADIWALEMLTGPHHLFVQGVMDPKSTDAGHMLDYLEESMFGRPQYVPPQYESQKDDWFSWGFPNTQPYYMRHLEIYAAGDDVKPFIRSYFNMIPSMINRENLAFFECPWNLGGAPNKVHETGSFLYQTSMMFAYARGGDLWLAPFVTNNWMQDGMVVEVKNLPTQFGKVSYRISSHVNDGFIEASVEWPNRQCPSSIVIRLRHPDGRNIRSAIVNGVPTTDFDPVGEWVHVMPSTNTTIIRAEY
ncbi:MAG: NPCBM/NEW2 domain-containing protein [Armatimonadota bacterium]|nr:NPCBM/NEW2 domain-containing protein [bacterium]